MKRHTQRKSPKRVRRQKGGAGYAPLQYVNPHYQMPAAWGPGENKSLPVPDLIARPALAANFAGGRRAGRSRTHKGGFFMPSIMSPVISNFGVVAPAVALAGYRYLDQTKGLSKKAMGLLPGRRTRRVKRR
jgi:hypothetical protein